MGKDVTIHAIGEWQTRGDGETRRGRKWRAGQPSTRGQASRVTSAFPLRSEAIFTRRNQRKLWRLLAANGLVVAVRI